MYDYAKMLSSKLNIITLFNTLYFCLMQAERSIHFLEEYLAILTISSNFLKSSAEFLISYT